VLAPALKGSERLTRSQLDALCQVLNGIRFRPEDRETGREFLTQVEKTCDSFRIRFAASIGLRQFVTAEKSPSKP
jgi:hypothetical protein